MRIDITVARKFKEAMLKILENKPRKIILNLREVEHVDSSGLGALVFLMQKVRQEGGELILCGLNTSLQTLMQISKLHHLFKICSSVEEALSR